MMDLKKDSLKVSQRDKYEGWERRMVQFCVKMYQAVQRFYSRRALTFREILLSGSIDREPMLIVGNGREKNYDQYTKNIAFENWVFTTLPGNNPGTNWPLYLPEFYSRFHALRPLALWSEPFDEAYTFQEAACQFISKSLENKEQKEDSLKLALLTLLDVTLSSGSYDRMASTLIEETLPDIKASLKDYERLLDSWTFLHHLRPNSVQGTFRIARNTNYNAQKDLNSSVATDGSYLYILICQGSRGCMYKVGTGEYGTVAGKVYLYAGLDKNVEGCWVYCKGKLYLRRAAEEIGLVSIICPHTFKKLGTLKLACEEAFKETATLKYNKSMPLLTDGDNLFAVTMQVKTVKRKLKQEKQAEYEKLKKDEEEEKRKEGDKAKPAAPKKGYGKEVKKEAKKQPQLCDTARICEFNLIEFDVSSQMDESEKAYDKTNEALIEELYDSFSGYFTRKECSYALRINKENMQNAAHWLVDEGENGRGKTVVIAKDSVLLGQAVIKAGTEMEMQEDSVLAPYNVTNGLWTMTKSQVTLHMSSGNANVFSTEASKIKPISTTGIEKKEVDKSATVKKEAEGWEHHAEFLKRMGAGTLSLEKDSSASDQSKADYFFEELELKGSYIATVPMEHLQNDHVAIAYDHLSHKFYILFANFIIGVGLEYGNVPAINSCSLSATLKQLIDCPQIEKPNELLAHYLFVFLKECESRKYSLPWRWDQWDTLYLRLSEYLRSSASKANDPVWKKANAKLMRKFEQFRKAQEDVWVEQFALKAQQLPVKSAKSIPPPHKIHTSAEVRALPPPDLLGSIPRHRYRVPMSFFKGNYDTSVESFFAGKYSEFARYTEEKLKQSANIFEPELNEERRAEKGKVVKTPQVLKENKRMHPFCCTGTILSLRLILDNIKQLADGPQGSKLQLWFYDNLLHSVGQLGVLAPAPQLGFTEDLERLSSHLLDTIRAPKTNPEVLSYAWRTLVNGWGCLVRTTERQSAVFQQLVRTKTHCGFALMKSKSFYEVMFSAESTPMTLFYMRHFQFPSSFFLDCPLRRSNVQVFDVFELRSESEQEKGKPKGRNKPRIKFTECPPRKHGSNWIIDIYCNKETWPKLSGLLLRSTKEIEDCMVESNGLSLDSVIEFYSSVRVPEDESIPGEELQKHKSELVRRLCEQHNERVATNWTLIARELLSDSQTNCSFMWKAFNKILIAAAEEVSDKGTEMIELATRCFDLLEDLLGRFRKVVEDKSEHGMWIDGFFEHLFWVSTLLNVQQGQKWETEYAVKIMPKLMNVLKQLKEMTAIPGDASKIATANTFSENIDYSYEKVFETSHPYGRGEFNMKEVMVFQNAIAILCEVDPRSQTEATNDYLNVHVCDSQSTVGQGTGATLRLSGKPSSKHNYIFVGDKAIVEFRVVSQARKKGDHMGRWGYKLTFRPIYGEHLFSLSKPNTPELNFKQVSKFNLADNQFVQLLRATNSFIALASRLTTVLIKGIDLAPEEGSCRELFCLPIVKEGIKSKHPPQLNFEPKTKPKPTAAHGSYLLKKEVMEPHVLKSINNVESNEGWIVSLMQKMRALVPIPAQYAIELKRASFEKTYQDKWALGERYVTLAFIYHSKCEIAEEGPQVADKELRKVGEGVNSVVQWMIMRLMGEKDYCALRVSILEDCNKFYESYKMKKVEAMRKREEKEVKKEAKGKEEKKEKPRKKKTVSVTKLGPTKRKKIRFEKPLLPAQDEPNEELTIESSGESVDMSKLPESERKEFKQKLYQQIYDGFLQRYQGNFDLVKGLCNVLAIKYTAKDPAEALKKIFKKVQEGLKDIIDLQSSASLPPNVEPSQLKVKNPYELVADHVIERVKFLLGLKKIEKKAAIPQRVGDAPLLPPLEIERTASLQPFLQDAKTPEEMRRAVDSYLRWKRAKIAMDEELMNSDSPLKAVVTVITEPTNPRTLRNIMKLQQKRGLLRVLGLGYQGELMTLFNKTMFKRLVIGSVSDGLLQGPFFFVEGSGGQIIGSIASHSLRLCTELIEALRDDCGKFKKIKRAVKKMVNKNIDNKVMDENYIREHMKWLLMTFSDLMVLLQGNINNNLIINLCNSSTTKALSEFLSGIVDIIMMSHSYWAELQANQVIAKLNTYLITSCQVVLNRFLMSAQEITAPEAKSSIQQLLLRIFVDTLTRECGLSKPVKNSQARFETPSYQLKFVELLTFLYETLTIFDRILDIDSSLLQRCASLLCHILHGSHAPCIIQLANKCAKLLYSYLDVDSISIKGIEFGNSSSPHPANIVSSFLRKMGQIIMMRDCLPPQAGHREYYVVININSSEDDMAFMLTALYHWENLHPFFSECYPQSVAAELQGQKESEFPGMLSNTKLQQQISSSKLVCKVYSAAMIQIEKTYDEVVRLTYEEIKEGDSVEEKERKLKEKNYNRRIKQHIQDAKLLCACLLTRSFVQFPVPLPYDQALELCSLIDKAYNKQLPSIPINPHMRPEAKTKRTSFSITVEASFPLVYKKMQKPPLQPPPPPIVIAKAQLTLSLCESTAFERIESHLDASCLHGTLARQKPNLDAPALELLYSPLTIGASFSFTLHELLQLLLSMLSSEKSASWRQHIAHYLSHSLKLLAAQKWSELSDEDKETVCGCLVLVGGWPNCVRPGTQVEAVVNNDRAVCTVVSGGYGTGKQTVTVVVKGDESHVTHKIPLDKVKPHEEFTWPEDIPLNEDLITKALLNCHQQYLEEARGDELEGQMVKLIRLLVLKVSASRNWGQAGESSKLLEKLVEVLVDLSKEVSPEIIKENCEEKLLEAWERLLESKDNRHKVFYATRRESQGNEKKEAVAVGKVGDSKQFLDYVQPMSSYLKSLPGKLSDSHASEESALKLLNYWEKHLIPKIQDFVRSSYQPWEFIYYFEQLRDSLRKGDTNNAMEEALVMCDRRLPSGCVVPDENHDWSAFVSEECIVGTWARVRVAGKKRPQTAHPLISHLLSQRDSEFVVLVKLVDWRNQTALCEYTTPTYMQRYSMIIPINSLKELERPLLPPSSSYSTGELVESFVFQQKNLAANCAFKTLISLWASMPTFKPKHSITTVPEIIHWIVMDEVSEDRIEGWLKLSAPLVQLEGLVYHKEEKETSRRIIESTLKSANQAPTEGRQRSNLQKIERLLKDAVRTHRVEDVAALHSWCLAVWNELADSLSQNRVSINLIQALEAYQRAEAKGAIELAKGKDGNLIFPLHRDTNSKSDIGALVINFETAAFLSPNSKLKFFSDSQGLNAVHQINAGKENIKSIPPIVISEGKVWCHIHQGTVANLPSDLQKNSPPTSLPCCIYMVPTSWNTVCWLTESLTTALLATTGTKALEEYYKPLVAAICQCVTKSKASSVLKQLAFTLVNRILRKMRFIYNRNDYVPGSCIEKFGLTLEWLQTLIEEIGKLHDKEDIGPKSLYSEYIQNGAELISSALLPFKSNSGHEELLDVKLIEKLKIPPWLRSILSVGIFLNYFRGEGHISQELQQTIFDSLSISEVQKKNIILIKSLPQTVTTSKLRTLIINALVKARARILNPDADILIPREDASAPETHSGVCIIFTDGFNITIESTLPKDQPEPPEAKEDLPEPAPKVSDWSCAVCTLINPDSAGFCSVCGSPKPAVSANLPELGTQISVEAGEMYQSKDMEESELWKELIEALRNIGMKEQVVKKETVQEEKEVKKEMKKEGKEVKKEGKEVKKEHKKAVKKEAKETKLKEKAEPVKIEYDFHVEVIANPLSDDMNKLLYNALKVRLGADISPETVFSSDVLAIIESIHKRIKEESSKSPILIPKHEFMSNVGLTQDQIPKLTLEEFTQELATLATCNPWLVWEFLALQGYDLWGTKTAYGSTKEMPTVCNLGLLEELVKLCEVDICKETKNVMKLSPTNLRFSPVDKPFEKMINGYEEVRLRAKHPKILSLGLDVIRYNWTLIKTFNDNLLKAVPYINWTMCVNSIPENSIPLTLSSFLSSARSLCFNYVKICLQQAVLEQTAVPRERPPKLFFERLKLAKGEKATDDDSKKRLTESMLYRAYEQVKEMDLTMLRPTKPKGSAPFLAFEIIFRGENVVGEGGPYRQFFADISAELQPSETSAGYTDTRSSALHLLCPTPNTKNKQGEGQDKYTFTPSSKSTTDLLLYEFLGILMGCCIRTGVRLSLDLPSIIWKQIVGEPLQANDLEAIDKSILNMIQYLTSPSLSPEAFAATFTENFTSLLSDESAVELTKGGANIAVTYDRREEYARLLLKSRVTESVLQCKAVRKGISLVVPIALLNFLTYQEVEALVCGKPVVDITLLKRHTRYSKGLSEISERVVLFWEVLSEFSETDKLRFIKFCWGQERLPANDEEYERRQVRFMVKPSMRKGGKEEAALPKADTCFFNLELPNYRTKQVMRERLLLAIHTDDVSMNAEDNSHEWISDNRLGSDEYID